MICKSNESTTDGSDTVPIIILLYCNCLFKYHTLSFQTLLYSAPPQVNQNLLNISNVLQCTATNILKYINEGAKRNSKSVGLYLNGKVLNSTT